MKLTHAAVPFFMTALLWADEKGTPLPKRSPFMPAGGAAVATAAASETVEFAGVSSVGKRVDLIFYDKTAKKSHWIGIGETKEGIAVLNYDSRREQVVVKLNGVEKTLPLRKGTGPVNSAGPIQAIQPGFNVPPPVAPQPAMVMPTPVAPPPTVVATDPAPTPVAPPMTKPEAPPTPETQAKQETEARMLVSDLLEIGMAQRKAYEEAQRRGADSGTQQPSEPPKQ